MRTIKKEKEKELTRQERARVASKAQAMAHKALREKDPEVYQQAYQRAKEDILKERKTGG